MAKVSIIMGIYNCAATLPEAIDSILTQTFSDWQLILCDDGSKDNTYTVAKAYQERLPDQIILLQNVRNMGLNYTLNRCLQVTTGEYVARMDGDDISLPTRLEKEAAFLDGCSNWQTYWKIVFPLLKPTIATVAIIDAMAFWNDYLLPSLVLGRKELYTLPIATQAFYGTYSTDMGLVMAALLLAMLPILILYLFLQRYIVEGVTSGAVKG